MKPKIKPIRDLYFRFIEGTPLDGKLNSQQCAEVLARHGFIELVPHKDKPTIEHYRDNPIMKLADPPDGSAGIETVNFLRALEIGSKHG